MTDEMIQRRENDGRLSYNYGVILNYLFKVKNEFAHVKNAEGIDSVESARKLLTENGITI